MIDPDNEFSSLAGVDILCPSRYTPFRSGCELVVYYDLAHYRPFLAHLHRLKLFFHLVVMLLLGSPTVQFLLCHFFRVVCLRLIPYLFHSVYSMKRLASSVVIKQRIQVDKISSSTIHLLYWGSVFRGAWLIRWSSRFLSLSTV